MLMRFGRAKIILVVVTGPVVLVRDFSSRTGVRTRRL